MNLKNSGNNRATNKRINLPTADYPPNIINLLMNKMKKDKHIKVLFHLEQDEDGYPPFSIEGLWCKKASNDTYLSIMCHSIPMESVWGMRYVLQKKMANIIFNP